MSPRNWKFRLEDIADSLDLIFEYVRDIDFSSWESDRKTIDAVIRNHKMWVNEELVTDWKQREECSF